MFFVGDLEYEDFFWGVIKKMIILKMELNNLSLFLELYKYIFI